MNPLVGLGPTAAGATLGPRYCRRHRTTAVDSGQLFSQLRSRERRNSRSLDRLMVPDTEGGRRFCGARRTARVMAPRAMPQQPQALLAKQARFVRNAEDRFGVVQRDASRYKRKRPIGAVKDGGR
jgi:hypothetical protein